MTEVFISLRDIAELCDKVYIWKNLQKHCITDSMFIIVYGLHVQGSFFSHMDMGTLYVENTILSH